MSAKIIIPDKHFILNSTAEVAEICAPLFNYLNITYFEYLRVDKEGYRACLSTNGLKIKYMLETEDADSVNYDFSFLLKNSEYFFWQDMSHHMPVKTKISIANKIADIRNIFNIDYGITIFETYNNYIEFFQFGSSPDNSSIIEFYLNNLDILKLFILYFKDKANDLLKLCAANRIMMPKFLDTNKANIATPAAKEIRNKFLKAIQHNRYFIDKNQTDVYLTRRELECLHMIANGYTAKETGKLLNISPRTVEDYVANIKLKLRYNTMAQAIKFYWEGNLKELFID